MSATKPVPGSQQALVAKPGDRGIAPRGPRFSAGITAVLLLLVIGLSLAKGAAPAATLRERVGQPAFIAAFLNSAFDYCFGCQIYLLLIRAGLIRVKADASA